MCTVEQTMTMPQELKFSNCQLQELIVTLMVIIQIEQFWYGLKDEISRILMMQFPLKKIELLQFCNQIEYVYQIVQNLLYLILLTKKMRQHDIRCKVCWDKGNMIVIMNTDVQPPPYTLANIAIKCGSDDPHFVFDRC